MYEKDTVHGRVCLLDSLRALVSRLVSMSRLLYGSSLSWVRRNISQSQSHPHYPLRVLADGRENKKVVSSDFVQIHPLGLSTYCTVFRVPQLLGSQYPDTACSNSARSIQIKGYKFENRNISLKTIMSDQHVLATNMVLLVLQ
jgi:hypothetical protein